MTARKDLIDSLAFYFHRSSWPPEGTAKGEAERLVDAFAHELAEQIRNSKELRILTDDHMRDCYAAADLIDPEMEN